MHPLLHDEVEVDGQKLSLHNFAFKMDMILWARRIPQKSFSKLTTLARTYLWGTIHTHCMTYLFLGVARWILPFDLTRNRERNLPRYSDARRQLFLEPYASLDELTDNEEDLKLLNSVYTNTEQLDFMVGCLADKHARKGSLSVLFLTTSSLSWRRGGCSVIGFSKKD